MNLQVCVLSIAVSSADLYNALVEKISAQF